MFSILIIHKANNTYCTISDFYKRMIHRYKLAADDMSDVTDKKENIGQEVAGDFFKDLRSAIFQKVGTPPISIITIFCIDNWDKLLFFSIQ